MPLPPCDDKKTLAYQFNSFFITKIEKIMEGLVPTNTHLVNPVYLESEMETTVILHKFRPITLDETKKSILSAAPKSCKLDPIPMKLLRNHIDALSTPTIQKIINISINNGTISTNMKEALLRPLLKNLNLDHHQFKSFRPVSNLSFVSKLLERAVCDQLLEHVMKMGKLEDLQSAYRSGHSTETALLKVKTDILDAMDKQRVTCLIILDLSAAFDTVLHKLLLNWLKYWFGITGSALSWIKSYLTQRSLKVVIDDLESDPLTLTQGVPQGSVLGPSMYTLFMSPLGDLYRSHIILYHGYADDTQNYHTFSPNTPRDEESCINALECCIDENRIWMRTNFCKLNDDKMEFLIIGTPQQLAKVNTTSIKIGQDNIQKSDVARNLGFYYDLHMKNTIHVNKLCNTLYLTLKKIAKIRQTIDMDMTRIFVQALVTLKLDYCNSLMLGSTEYNIANL